MLGLVQENSQSDTTEGKEEEFCLAFGEPHATLAEILYTTESVCVWLCTSLQVPKPRSMDATSIQNMSQESMLPGHHDISTFKPSRVTLSRLASM